MFSTKSSKSFNSRSLKRARLTTSDFFQGLCESITVPFGWSPTATAPSKRRRPWLERSSNVLGLRSIDHFQYKGFTAANKSRLAIYSRMSFYVSPICDLLYLNYSTPLYLPAFGAWYPYPLAPKPLRLRYRLPPHRRLAKPPRQPRPSFRFFLFSILFPFPFFSISRASLLQKRG